MHASPFCCMGLLSPLSLLCLGGDQAPPCLLPNTAPFLSCMIWWCFYSVWSCAVSETVSVWNLP